MGKTCFTVSAKTQESLTASISMTKSVPDCHWDFTFSIYSKSSASGLFSLCGKLAPKCVVLYSVYIYLCVCLCVGVYETDEQIRQSDIKRKKINKGNLQI